ncbi:MAG: cell division protein ZapA [Saprospiraceae bacterium]|nr:cell division protein ZapA [Saprospiraceae bacterium]
MATEQAYHTIPVTVLIGGRPYLLKINAADEALVHRLAKEINDKTANFKSAQPSKDTQDCLAMALLTYAVELHRSRRQATVKPSERQLQTV